MSTEPVGCGRRDGFSLIELMIAMAITLGIGMIVFQLFLQNEQVFRDQNLVLELQQSARAVASMMNDEIRMAGQGVPVYSAKNEGQVVAATETFLGGTGTNAIRFRAGVRNGTARVAGTMGTLANAQQVTFNVDDDDPIVNIVGGNSNRYLYLWGAGDDWVWVRARIDSVASDQVTATVDQLSTLGGEFNSRPHLSVEEALEYRLNGTLIERGESGDFSNPQAPVMSYATVGENFTALTFEYRDAAGNVVTPTTLADRATIRQVVISLVAQTSAPLASTGAVDSYAVSMTVYPRNVSIY